jgi:acetoin utilization deacetylase AcuC-like enzyme
MHCFYHPVYFIELPPNHPFPMEKFPQAFRMLNQQVRQLKIKVPHPASTEDLLRVHSANYLAKLAAGTFSESESFRIGFAVTPELFLRCRYETGGTLAAVQAALSEGLAANLAGGTHHAFPDRGGGFCLLNDVAVAIRSVKRRFSTLRILVIDTDAHQGDGTHFIFRHEPEIFTYSIHVGKNYPARKEPGDLDVELPRWVPGEFYLAELKRTLPEAIDSFDPELLIWISGVDPHQEDRFGQMQLATEDLATRDRLVLELHRTFEVPMAILYGGGYNKIPGETPHLHASTISLAYQLCLGPDRPVN